MADTMQFDLVSPERRLAGLAAREVQIVRVNPMENTVEPLTGFVSYR